MTRIDEALRRTRRPSGDAEPTTPGTTPPAAGPAAPAGEDGPGDVWHVSPGVETTPPAPASVASAPAAMLQAPAPGAEPHFATAAAAIPGVFDKLNIESSRLPPAAIEQYRRLAASLHHAQVDRGIKTVLIGSALGGEGKSLTATNLALTLSESYRRRVLLVDADLRRPSLDKVFQVTGMAGLSDGLSAGADHRLPVAQISTYLTLLPAGRPTPDPMAQLTSNRMKHILAEAREAFDWVILDTPPIALLTDASLLGSMVDAAILVVRAAHTPLAAVKKALTTLGRQKVMGIVLNRAEHNGHGRYSDYHYSHYGSD